MPTHGVGHVVENVNDVRELSYRNGQRMPQGRKTTDTDLTDRSFYRSQGDRQTRVHPGGRLGVHDAIERAAEFVQQSRSKGMLLGEDEKLVAGIHQAIKARYRGAHKRLGRIPVIK